MRAAILLGAALSACSLGALEGFSGGAKESGADGGDAGANGGDAGAVSADGGPTSSSDGGAPVATNACPAGALLCDSFERDGVLGSVWTRRSGDPMIVQAPTGGRTGRSLAAKLGGGGTPAFVERSFTETPLHLVVAFSVLAPTRPTENLYEIAKLVHVRSAGEDESLFFYLGNGGLDFGMKSDPSYVTATALEAEQVFDGNWHSISIEVDRTVKPQIARVTADGVTRPPLTLQSFAVGPPDTMFLQAGFTYGDGPASGTVFIDDLFVRPP